MLVELRKKKVLSKVEVNDNKSVDIFEVKTTFEDLFVSFQVTYSLLAVEREKESHFYDINKEKWLLVEELIGPRAGSH